jgi:hypothetical protein
MIGFKLRLPYSRKNISAVSIGWETAGPRRCFGWIWLQGPRNRLWFFTFILSMDRIDLESYILKQTKQLISAACTFIAVTKCEVYYKRARNILC